MVIADLLSRARAGDGGADQMIIAGHHRGTHGRGFARMVLARLHLTGFRVQGVYSPALIRALTRPLSELGRDHAPRLRKTRYEAEHAATIWRTLPLTACADDWPFTTMVTDPPPAEITWQGQRYYLAHFNAHRVIYSRLQPPAEPPGWRLTPILVPGRTQARAASSRLSADAPRERTA
jgi:hypothetical protein